MPFILIFACLIFILDQVTKFWVRTAFSPGQSHPVFPGIFHLTFITNTGSAFGLFTGGGIIFILFSIFTLVVLSAIVWQKRKNLSPMIRISFGFLLGGILGNLTDRVRFGAVVDFLDFRIWPVFNVADSAITLGALFLSFHLIKKQSASCTL